MVRRKGRLEAGSLTSGADAFLTPAENFRSCCRSRIRPIHGWWKTRCLKLWHSTIEPETASKIGEQI